MQRDLLGAPAVTVAAERARVATDGWGARMLAAQRADGSWGGVAWNHGFDSTMHALMLLRELGLDWITLRRTGDSRSTERAKVKRGECDALITTPESLALLLSYDDSVERFAALDAVVVDEWHELMGTKRGVLLELALARLRTLAPRMRTWGLSATLGNLEQARDVLLGPAATGRLVHGDADKRVDPRNGPRMADALRTHGIPVELEMLPGGAHRTPLAGLYRAAKHPEVLTAIMRFIETTPPARCAG